MAEKWHNKFNPLHRMSRSSLSKHDVRYWQTVVFRQTYQKDGKVHQTKDWSVRIQFAGRRKLIPLQTPNKSAAASKAKRLYETIVNEGWDVALDEFHKPVVPTIPEPSSAVTSAGVVTIGDFFRAAEKLCSASEASFKGYCRAVRLIVGHSFNLRGGKDKYNYSKGGTKAWREKIEAIPLAALTPEVILAWKRSYLHSVGPDLIAQRRRRTSTISLLKEAKCLFSRKILRFVPFEDPIANPFDDIELESKPSPRYRSNFDLAEVIRLAQEGDQQKQIEPLPREQWKIFLLAAFAGLRRNEIDKLEWPSFRWKEGILRIEPTEYFQPKTEESLGDVEVDQEFLTLFEQYHEVVDSRFVIESDVPPRAGASCYRCDSHFRSLCDWLRQVGVDQHKPMHTLRKEFGSQVCNKHGIYTASRALRHASIHITALHYLDKRERKEPGLGGLLSGRAA